MSLLFVIVCTLPFSSSAVSAPDDRDPSLTYAWPHWGGDAGGQRYSPLTQIHRSNVGQLKRAWTYLGRKTGKQFVVIAAGGGNKYSRHFSDALVAFALPFSNQ